MRLLLNSLEELEDVAHQFIEEMDDDNVFAFYGEMGAGKTTLIKAVCKQLGVSDTVNSPTFAIINEYTDKQGESIFHFDFYRIENQEEVFDMGYEDYFYSGKRCFIEWPEKIQELLPENHTAIHITINDDQSRTIEIMK